MKLREVLKLGKGYGRELTKGILKENPVFRLVLGTCPTLAVSTSAMSALGMGAAATVVLICSNLVISACRKIIPDKVRIPAYITIIAGFVSVVQMLVKAFVPAIDKSLGIYLPLIVVNCIILGRAEAFASKNPVIPSVLDGLGMGIGFTAALLVMGCIRELLGSGTYLWRTCNYFLYGSNYYLYSCSGWILCLWYPSCYCKQINQRQKSRTGLWWMSDECILFKD